MVRRRYYRNDDDFLNVLIILIILGAIYSFVTKYWLIILIIAGLVLLYLFLNSTNLLCIIKGKAISII